MRVFDVEGEVRQRPITHPRINTHVDSVYGDELSSQNFSFLHFFVRL